MADPDSIGARMKAARGKLITQRQLAEMADVSLSLIKALEGGQRHTAQVGNLQKIAKALDLELPDLLGKRAALPTADGGVVDIRRALTPVDDLLDGGDLDGEPVTIDEARRTVSYLWGAYWAGRYELLGALLPDALAQLRATAQAVDSADALEASSLLARGYQAAGDTLVHLGQPDAAWLAVRQAIDAARKSEDVLLYAAMRVSVSWQLLVQGRYLESERVAVAAAHDIEPHGTTSDTELAAYGMLTVTAATAAARLRTDGANGRAADLLGEAKETADRLGYERSDHQSSFGPAKVAMLTVDCAVVRDDWTGALTAAKALPREAPLPLATRARHLADVALAQLRLGHGEKALSTVLAMESMAPDWIQYQTLPRQVVSELVERERRMHDELRDLARRLGAIGKRLI
ncbi:helix-turn-helix domain-containing protein [Amycolatopsis sp. YIM 10]|uniref:helix-turn-helix domain-containing protein n=1 Tax=Amycolatopsis sp. YIM 10 TaxID=2653857 RepID=UPI0012907F53|nr:helix-turn-helix transcriptional regulator [Amycolatopsis sp. YIM 10]QFU87901.1 anaerobic benzoate catabolism transcriptional regulator [Amycolatopsis sp. YIM 10]QFU94786.1 anaerobic benzoate catabolism transcriptional regulator [Amycolatopsis sp. YIM 10]